MQYHSDSISSGRGISSAWIEIIKKKFFMFGYNTRLSITEHNDNIGFK